MVSLPCRLVVVDQEWNMIERAKALGRFIFIVKHFTVFDVFIIALIMWGYPG